VSIMAEITAVLRMPKENAKDASTASAA
jgi:hypothetical protein